MVIYVAATAIGRRRFFIDLTNWDRLERYHKPFLVNTGWPEGLAGGVVDIGRYMEELSQIYKEAAEATNRSQREFVKAAAKMDLEVYTADARGGGPSRVARDEDLLGDQEPHKRRGGE